MSRVKHMAREIEVGDLRDHTASIHAHIPDRMHSNRINQCHEINLTAATNLRLSTDLSNLLTCQIGLLGGGNLRTIAAVRIQTIKNPGSMWGCGILLGFPSGIIRQHSNDAEKISMASAQG